MKLKRLILASALSLYALSAVAQTGIKTGTPYGSGEDSVRCLENISLLSNNAKNKNFVDAEKYWRMAYAECPGSHKNIYIYGAQILDWKISNEQDSAKRAALLDELMAMYDKRIEYFGGEHKYGTDWIITTKAQDYIRFAGEATDYNKVYGWLKPIVEKNQNYTSPTTLNYYVFSSLLKAYADSTAHDQYVKDYMMSAKYLNEQLANETDPKRIEEIQNVKEPMDDLFGRSGLASCEVLKQLYTDADIDAHKTDTAYLKTVTAIFQEAENCEAPVYYKAAKYLFEQKPSSRAAIGLAYEAMSKGKNAEAMNYLNKAVELSKDAKERANCYYAMATIRSREHSYAAARQLARQSISENPHKGEAYILIAQMYAASAGSIFPGDPVKQRCVYYLAIDKLSQARSADPQIAGRVNSLIARYSRSLPAASDVFMHPELGKGKSFFVGGWIGESTIIR